MPHRPWVEPLRELKPWISECVHCGLCLPSCPTHALLGTEMDSPRGRIYLIRAMAEQRIDPTPTVLRHLDRCLDCRACETACPSGVRYGAIIEGARAALEPHRTRGKMARLLRSVAMDRVLPHRRVLGLMRLGLFVLHASGLSRGRWRRAVPVRWRRLLAFAPRPRGASYLSRMPAVLPAEGKARGEVGLFLGCVMDQLQGDVHRATARVLSRSGFTVKTPADQGCCGALHAHNGDLAAAEGLRKANDYAFSWLETVVVNSAGCGAHLSRPEGRPRFVDLSLFLHETEGLSFTGSSPPARKVRAVFDEPCHLLHAQKIAEAPRALLRRVPRLELLELVESDWCCGAAGIYNLTQPELSDRLLARKLDHIVKSGAEMIITANPGCAFQLEAGLRARGLKLPVLHLAEVLDRFGLEAARRAKEAE